ncbi:GNAT superfamily N-acetyltransferase [Inhella inkyongensis]|uniref:GNAT superfamily N-acetyltransferase n=1 Tax=Inhella inkyongensis TaxID=392593 RepID=A0A840S6F7_9BURK|nr:GNAT family N-acetyltransferase [Inhella inkyongensis]MBB5206015.1 GNAT superfamily N-acetyltransferase [Inhella inkyongensis]
MSSLQPTHHIPAPVLHAGFLRAFENYVAGPVQVELAHWPALVLRGGVDLSLGRAALDEQGQVLGFALVAPRPPQRSWRLAAMGLRPEARGTGLAGALLTDFAERARAAGMSSVELEVFEQNPCAKTLYERHGFRPRCPLMGYRREPDARPAACPVAADGASAVPPQAALDWLVQAEIDIADLPLQVGPTTVAALLEPWTPWRLGQAQMIVSGGGDKPWQIRSLVDRSPGQQDAEALLRAWLPRQGAQPIQVGELQRPDLGGEALLRCGFERTPLHQWLMRKDL